MRVESFAPDLAQLMSGTQNISIEGDANSNQNNLLLEDNMLNDDDDEDRGAKLSSEEIGSAKQLKAFGAMLISIAAAILHWVYRMEVIGIKPDAPS